MVLTAFAPSFVGLPGGMELAVILLVALVVFGVPVLVIVAGGGYLLTRTSKHADEDRVEELEARVEELEAELDSERSNAGDH